MKVVVDASDALRGLTEYSSRLVERASDGVQRIAERVASEAQRNLDSVVAPGASKPTTDTGALRNSIHITGKGLTREVKAGEGLLDEDGQEYAARIEFGRTPTIDKPFLKNGQPTAIHQWASRKFPTMLERVQKLTVNKPHPYMRPAAETTREEAADLMKEGL